jgi:hypothetical protein
MLSNMQGAMSNAVVRDPKERAQAHSVHSNWPLSGILSLPSEDLTDPTEIAPERPHRSRWEDLPAGPIEMTNANSGNGCLIQDAISRAASDDDFRGPPVRKSGRAIFLLSEA